MIPGVRYLRIDDQGLHVEIGGQATCLEVDHVVVCAGQEPERALYDDLVDAGVAAHLVGVMSQILFPRIDQNGRIVAAELMFCNAAIRNNIRNGKVESIYQTLQTSKGDGMMTMDHSLINLVKAGKISYETARPYVQDETTHQILQQLDKSLSSQERSAQEPGRSAFRSRPFFNGGQGAKVN